MAKATKPISPEFVDDSDSDDLDASDDSEDSSSDSDNEPPKQISSDTTLNNELASEGHSIKKKSRGPKGEFL